MIRSPRLIVPALALLGGLQAHVPTAEAAPAACEVVGTVVDAEGKPVAGLDVRLEPGAKVPHTTTDADGRFRFARVTAPVEVVATLQEGGPRPRFVVVESASPFELRASVDPAAARCEVALGPSPAAPQAADLLALYQGLRRGFALFEQLGIARGPLLRVEANDPIASPNAAYWVGTSSFNPKDVQTPRIVLGTAATRRSDPGAPDDREYHELGHHALATAFGALPRTRDHVDGGGYHRNRSSADAWSEGFAVFFAALVAREIEQRPSARLHRVEGAWIDLELDYRPWDLGGTEAVAVASLLWDVVDGDQVELPATLEITEPKIFTNAGVPHLLVAQVHNPTNLAITDARVRVEASGFSGTAVVLPSVLAPAARGTLALPLPADVATAADAATTLSMRAFVAPATKDDDLVQVELPALWTAIVELRGERPDANGRLLDVLDLYTALRGRFAQDRDGDGLDDIDALFIAHGLFADLDGNREHDPSEALGLTSHPGRTLVIDGKEQTWPDLLPRYRLELPPMLRIHVKTEPADAALAVLVSGSAWGGYAVAPTADGWIRMVPPPAIPGASASLLAISPDHRPTVVWHQDAGPLLAELEHHAEPFWNIDARLPTLAEAQAQAAADAATAASPRWSRIAFLGGCIAALVGLVLIAIGWPRLR